MILKNMKLIKDELEKNPALTVKEFAIILKSKDNIGMPRG